MRIVVYLALGGALVLCLVARRAARYVSPPLAAVTLAVSASLAATAWAWNLALLAGTLIGRVGYVADVGHWSRQTLAVHDPVPVANAAIAGLFVAIAAGALAWSVHKVGQELWQIWAAARACPVPTDGGVVVVDDPAPRALAVPGLRGRVVITTAMVRALDAEERRVLFAHERTHLRCQHGLFRLAVRLSAAVLPLLRPLVRDCDYQLERWADESAASAVGDRGLAAQALARAALAGRHPRRTAPGAAMGFAEYNVTSRVQALLAEPPRSNLRRLALPLVLLATTATLSIEAGKDLEALFELAKRVWAA
jgi:Zn-dependent protease with chaperone function